MSTEQTPRPTAARLSLYLRCLETWAQAALQTASSRQLASTLGLDAAQVRKDLAQLGNLGRRGIGYAIPALIEAIRKALGIDREWRAVLVGVGNLARALLRYRGFTDRGFRIVALFDADPEKSGDIVDGVSIYPMSELSARVRRLDAELGIVAVPAEAAQSVAQSLADAGVRGVLNFAPTVLQLPPTVRIVNVDLTIQLEQLAFQVASERS